MDGVVVGENLRASPTASSSRTRSRRSRRFRKHLRPSTAASPGRRQHADQVGPRTSSTVPSATDLSPTRTWTVQDPVAWARPDHVRRDRQRSTRRPSEAGSFPTTSGSSAGAGTGRARPPSGSRAFTNLPFDNGFDEALRREADAEPDGLCSPFYASYVNIKNDETNNFLRPDHGRRTSIVLQRSLPNTLLALNYNGVIGKNFVAEAAVLQEEVRFQGSGELFKDPIIGKLDPAEPPVARPRATTRRSSAESAPRRSATTTPYSAKGTYFWNSANLGSHSVVLGGERFQRHPYRQQLPVGERLQLQRVHLPRRHERLSEVRQRHDPHLARPSLRSRPERTWRRARATSTTSGTSTPTSVSTSVCGTTRTTRRTRTANVVSSDSALSPRLGAA